MGHPRTDAVDLACEAWAYQWVNLFARVPLKASEQLGRVGSTLDLIKIMHDGAGGSSGFVTQFFPDVFLGDGLVIACALKFMSDRDREILWVHYVDRWYYLRVVAVKTADGHKIYEHTREDWQPHPLTGQPRRVRAVDRGRPTTQTLIERRARPIKQGLVAAQLGISRVEYHRRRDRVKTYLRGILDSEKCCYTKVGHEDPVLV